MNGCKEIIEFKKELKNLEFKLFNFVGSRDAKI